MLIDEIKKANMQALKNRDSESRASLSIVINKYMNLSIENKTKGVETTDVDAVNIVSKTLKELEEEQAAFDSRGDADRVLALATQIKAIATFMPRQMGENEIRLIVESLTDKSIGSVMKHFKTNFAGQVDMTLVSKVLRSL